MASCDLGQLPKIDLALGLKHRRSSGYPAWQRVRVGLACLAFWGSGSGGVTPAGGSWIDPDTLPEDRSKTFVGDEREFGLVFSDEFDRCVRYVCTSVCVQYFTCDNDLLEGERSWFVQQYMSVYEQPCLS